MKIRSCARCGRLKGFILKTCTCDQALNITEFKVEKFTEQKIVVKDDGLILPEKNDAISRNCTKCGHGFAIWAEGQIRAPDEGSSVFYRCLKCGDTVREDGTGIR